MKYELIGKLVNPITEKTIGYKISVGTPYTAVVTKGYAQQIGVDDIDIAEYYDLEVTEAVEVGKDKFGVVANSTAFIEDLASAPVDYFGDNKTYYGYIFKDNQIVTLNSDSAIQRMLASKTGDYVDG